jgi:ketosteroid isomerase-like protein
VKIDRAIMLALLAATPAPAFSQFPGGQLVGAERLRYEFAQRMQIELAGYLREWEQGWQSDPRRNLSDHYLRDALVLQPDGRFVQGRAEIRPFAATMSSLASEALTSMTDFEVSEGIAYTYGPYALKPAGAPDTPHEGQLVSVLFKDNDRWYIRAQLFLAGDGAAILPVPVGNSHLPPFSLPAGATSDMQARYAEAATLLGSFRSAWNERSVQRAGLLLSPQALILLPGEESPARGAAALAALERRLPDFGTLTTAVLDYDGRARVSFVLGRYHVQAAGGGRTGSFIMVLADQGEDMKVRAILFR